MYFWNVAPHLLSAHEIHTVTAQLDTMEMSRGTFYHHPTSCGTWKRHTSLPCPRALYRPTTHVVRPRGIFVSCNKGRAWKHGVCGDTRYQA